MERPGAKRWLSLAAVLVFGAAGGWVWKKNDSVCSQLSKLVCEAVDKSVGTGHVTADGRLQKLVGGRAFWMTPATKRKIKEVSECLDLAADLKALGTVQSQRNSRFFERFNPNSRRPIVPEETLAEQREMMAETLKINALIQSNLQHFIHLCKRSGI